MKKKNLLLLILFVPFLAFSQLNYTTIDFVHAIDFEATQTGVIEGTFNGSGFATTPVAGQLDADAWEILGLSDGDKLFGDENIAGDCARGASIGGVSTGGIYAFNDPSTGTTLGIQPGGSDMTPGSITLKVDNNTGVTVESFQVLYNAYMFNDMPRSNSISFSWSTDNITFVEGDGNMFSTTILADGTPAWADFHRIIKANITILDGQSLYLKWSIDDKAGESSQGYRLLNFQ